MAKGMALLKPLRPSVWEGIYLAIGVGAGIIYPGANLVHSYFSQQESSPLWMLGLLGLGALLTLIYETLKQIARDLSALTRIVYQVLKDTDEEEAAISLATFHYLRQRLGLHDAEEKGNT